VQDQQLLPSLFVDVENADLSLPLAGAGEGSEALKEICYGELGEDRIDDTSLSMTKSTNAKAWAALSDKMLPFDLLLFNYVLYDGQDDRKRESYKFFQDLVLSAKPGAALVIVDVLHRSKMHLDDLYESLMVAVEAQAPKQKPSISLEEALAASDGTLQGLLLDAGSSQSAIERVYRQLSLRLHPDKNHDKDGAEKAFNRLKEMRDAVIRGHDLIKQDDGSVVVAPLAMVRETEAARSPARNSKGLLLRYDIPSSENHKAEVMVLIKGPIDLKAPTKPAQ